MEYGDFAFEKILTRSDVHGRFAVPRGMAKMMPRGDIQINVLERYDGREHVYHFKLSRRRGTYEKPVFQAKGWGDFIRRRGARQGDLIRFWHEVNEAEGTQYRIALLKIYL